MRRFLTITYTWARRCAIAVIGSTVVLIGVAMIVLPGPALIVIPAGLAILGIEFAFARRWLRQLRTTGSHVVGYTMQRFTWFRSRSNRDGVERTSSDIATAHCSTPEFARTEVAITKTGRIDTRHS